MALRPSPTARWVFPTPGRGQGGQRWKSSTASAVASTSIRRPWWRACGVPGDITEGVEELISALGRFRDVLAAGSAEEPKAVVSAFLQEIRVKKATRQAISYAGIACLVPIHPLSWW